MCRQNTNQPVGSAVVGNAPVYGLGEEVPRNKGITGIGKDPLVELPGRAGEARLGAMVSKPAEPPELAPV
ncbi:MAG: hypothetical protein JWR69_1130 [Pedosphaera sp.]|nr:hypothetical protein [Pedosphaera sp.]